MTVLRVNVFPRYKEVLFSHAISLLHKEKMSSIHKPFWSFTLIRQTDLVSWSVILYIQKSKFNFFKQIKSKI